MTLPVPLMDACDHPHDTTTRYDASRKLLSVLLVGELCGTERLIHTVRYEPRFESDSRRHAPLTR